MIKNTLLALTVAVSTVGCATGDEYRQYAEAQKSVAQARSMAEIARYSALAEIAKQGDTAAKVAAVMSLNQGNVGQTQQQVLNPPKSAAETALQWTSLLLPSLTNLYGISANRQVAVTQSNNAAAVAQSTNATFATMNGNMATSNTAIAGAGLTAATTIANTGLTSVTSVANTGMNNLSGLGIKIVETIPLLQPNVTTTTTNANPVTTTTTNNTTAP